MLKMRIISVIVILFLISACSFMGDAPGGEPSPELSSTQAAESASATPTAAPAPTTLTVCLGQEPNTLYPYDNPNTAARNVLSVLYDGPIDSFMNGDRAVIVERIPSIENGDAQFVPVTVKRGDYVVDSDGKVAVLDFGVRVYPSGCNDEACLVVYDGSDGFQMDQLIVTFHLLPNLTWSDGTPLTAEDSVYAYQLAADPASKQPVYLIDRTKAYEAIDDLTTQWWGLPGFIDPTYADNFWAPFPKHAWSDLSAAQLLAFDHTKRVPLGWGPYRFEEWVSGEFMRFSRNDLYFRIADGLPRFDTLMIKFLPDAESGISALTSGECDVLDPTFRLEGQTALLRQMQQDGLIKLVVATTPLIERLDFGISPSSYDNGYSTAGGDRPNLFGDVRTRQALAQCINRQAIVDDVLLGYSAVPNTFLSPYHPLASDDVSIYDYDVAAASTLLDEVGWIDADKDPSTPRTAFNISDIPTDTPLIVHLITTQAVQRRQVSEIIESGLISCGVGVTVDYLDQNEFFASGPESVLFGRQFDLAEYAVGVIGYEPACNWFTEAEIPAANNQWAGLNVSGYRNPDYDILCNAAKRTLPDMPEHAQLYNRLQQIYSNDMPSIPLYMRLRVAAARTDLCNFSIDISSSGDLWNIEELDFRSTCIEN